MSSQALASVLILVVAGILSLANQKGWLPENYNALAAAVLGLLSQIVLAFVAQRPELTDTITLILNVVVAVLVSLGAVVETPKAVFAQIRSMRKH